MELEDMDGVHEAWREAWREAYPPIVGEENVEDIVSNPSEERYRKHLEERDINLVVEIDEEIAGFTDYVFYTEVPDTESRDTYVPHYAERGEAELSTLYVHPDYWNQGVGTLLLEEGIERIPEGITRLRVKTFSENWIGRKFYESRGFEKTGEIDDEIAGEIYRTTVYALEMD